MEQALDRWLMGAVRAVLVVGVATLAGTVFLQVVARYLFQSPPFWTEELARFVLIWLTFLGAVLVQHHREHISADMLLNAMPGRMRTAADILVSLVVIATLAVILRGGLAIATLGTQTAPALGISMRWIYLSLPVGAGLMILVTLVQLARQVRDLVSGKAGDVA